MTVKVTPQAATKLKTLSNQVRKTLSVSVTSAPFPDLTTDRRLDLDDYSGDLWVRPIADGQVNVVYHFNDVDGDGVQDVVLLSIVTRDELAPSAEPAARSGRARHQSRLTDQLTDSLASAILE